MKKVLYFTLTFSALALLVTGCSSTQKENQPKEYTSVPLYMAGQEIPGDAQEKYLSNAGVKMYSVGRIVDPGSGTMREAGTVYRIETAPKWNLIPQYDANPESFARKQLKAQYAQTLAGQMSHTLAETRSVKETVADYQRRFEQADKMFDDVFKENERMRKDIERQHENTRNLLESLKKMQRYIELLEQKVNDRNTMTFGGAK